MTLKTLIDTIDKHEKIIALQQEIINDLFNLLSLHLSSEELDNLDVISKINRAEKMRRDIQWEAQEGR